MQTSTCLTALALVLAACATPAQSTEPLTQQDPVPHVRQAPTAPGLPEQSGDRIVLDERGELVIAGRLLPFPLDADPPRVIELDASVADLAPELVGARVLDARFAGDSIVLVTPDHALSARDASGRTVELDTEAHAPLSIAAGRVAYARGSIPELEIAVADLSTGTAQPWTTGMAPAWAPALSEDGRSVVFVSGASGWPRLHRIDDAGQPRMLPRSERWPSSARAPRWTGDVLAFDDERGEAAIDLRTGEVVALEPGGSR